MNLIKGKIPGFKLNPPRVLALGFASLILIGSLLLNLPIATKTGESIGYIDALFTSASAVCVTGLAVVNTGEFWSLFGQITILVLIQMGGLGFMTMATVGALAIGKKITLKERLVFRKTKSEYHQVLVSIMVLHHRLLDQTSLMLHPYHGQEKP